MRETAKSTTKTILINRISHEQELPQILKTKLSNQPFNICFVFQVTLGSFEHLIFLLRGVFETRWQRRDNSRQLYSIFLESLRMSNVMFATKPWLISFFFSGIRFSYSNSYRTKGERKTKENKTKHWTGALIVASGKLGSPCQVGDMGYWPSLFGQDGWMLAKFFFCVFMDCESQTKSRSNIQSSWPNKLGQ